MIGSRIKLGRLASALSLQELAEALDESGYKITRAALSKYETGKILPNETFLSVLSQVLGLDKSFFSREVRPSIGIKLFCPRDMIPKQASELEAYLQINLEQRLMVDELLGLRTSLFLPNVLVMDQGREWGDIDSLADHLRAQWGNQSQVIASVCGLLEDNGWYVFEIPSLFGVESVSGIETNSGRPFLAFAHDETVDNTRFNIMKEVGYAYLWCGDPEQLEELCCYFSRAVLMPKARVLSEFPEALDVPDYRALSLLKQRYGMSKIQIRMRLQDLGLYAANSPKSSAKSVERIQARMLMDSKLELMYFYENPIRFKLRVMEAGRRGLLSQQETSSLLPKRYT